MRRFLKRFIQCQGKRLKEYIRISKELNADSEEIYQKAQHTILAKQIEIQENSGKQEANGKAKKSAGRMPWHWEPKKDVINCDKPRGAVSTL